jgi:predicted RNase H-like HicB family nuclease
MQSSRQSATNALAYQGMNYMTYVIGLLHRIEDSVSVTFPDLPGCIAQGDTIEAALENARKAVAFHVEGLFQNGETAPELHTLDARYADPQFAEYFAYNAKVALVPLKLPAASA